MTWKDAVGLALEGREEGYNFLYQQTYQKSYYVALKLSLIHISEPTRP